MNIIKYPCLAVLTLLAAGFARAEDANPRPAGLLGQRYVEAGIAVVPHHDGTDGSAAETRLAVPVAPHADVALTFHHTRLDSTLSSAAAERLRNDTAFADVIGYATASGVRPFASLGLGYEWVTQKLRFASFPTMQWEDHSAAWRAGAGLEIPVSAVTLVPSIVYHDASGHGRNRFTYALRAQTWLTRRWGAFLRLAYEDPRGPKHEVRALPSSTTSFAAGPIVSPTEPSGQIVIVPPGLHTSHLVCAIGAELRF